MSERGAGRRPARRVLHACRVGRHRSAACVPETCIPWEGCCSCGGHFYASAEAVFFATVGNRNFASYTVDPDHITIVHYDTDGVANDGLVATPRITLGYQGECWGVHVRYWRMGDPNEVNNVDVLNWTGAYQQTCTRAETLDLELTRLFCWGETQMQWAFGVRYGEFEQSASLAAYATTGSGDDTDYYGGIANARHTFAGAGLTTALTGVRPIGCGNFNLFYSCRASLLWDSNTTTQVTTVATYEAPAGWYDYVNSDSAGARGNLFIGELQVGGQYELRPEVHSGQRLRPCGLRVPILGSDQQQRRCRSLLVASRELRCADRYGVCPLRRRQPHQPARL